MRKTKDLVGKRLLRTLSDEKLIDLIYAAMLGEANWADFLRQLSNMLPGGKSTLFYHDVSLRQGAWELSDGFEADALDRYSSYYCSINPWMLKASVRKVGLGVVADKMLPAAELAKTEFYNDFLREQGCASAVGVTILREGGRSFLLSTLTSQADPEANMEAANRLTILAPHLRRAFGHLRYGLLHKQVGEIGALLSDALNVGLIVVDEDRRVKSASSEGQRILEAGSCIGTTVTGRLKLLSTDGERLLAQLTSRSYQGNKIVALTINSIRLSLIRVSKDSISSYFEGPTVIILLESPSFQPATELDLNYYQQAYGLKKSELRALSGLLESKSVDEIARAAELSRETIRSQIKSLYAKLGVRSERELLRLVHLRRR